MTGFARHPDAPKKPQDILLWLYMTLYYSYAVNPEGIYCCYLLFRKSGIFKDFSSTVLLKSAGL